jgi:hypothetical protein
MSVHACDTCQATPARFFFLGWRCEQHAPSEQQIRRHAQARATALDNLRRRNSRQETR